jgi:hypothetical protein
MSERGITAIERIIMDTIYDHALGNPEALAARIVAALAEAGYRIAPMEDTALGSQPFDELTPEKRPQDPYETAGIGHSKPVSTAATSPTICLRRLKRRMQQGAGRFMCRLPVAERSWFRARTRRRS